MPSYIHDGYEQDGYIRADVPRDGGESLHGELRFRFRFPARMDIAAHETEVANAKRGEEFDPQKTVDAEKLVNKFVAKYLISWDLKNVAGHAIKPSEDTVARVAYPLFWRLYKIISGVLPGDKDPNPKNDALQTTPIGELQGNSK